MPWGRRARQARGGGARLRLFPPPTHNTISFFGHARTRHTHRPPSCPHAPRPPRGPRPRRAFRFWVRRRARLYARAHSGAHSRAAPRVPRAHIPLPLSSTSAAVSCAEPPSLAMVAAVAFRALTPPLLLWTAWREPRGRGGCSRCGAAADRQSARARPNSPGAKHNKCRQRYCISENDLGNNAWFKV